MNRAKYFIATLLVLALCLSAKPLYMIGKAFLAQYLLTQAWQQSQTENIPLRPWFWADTYPIGKLNFYALKPSNVLTVNTNQTSPDASWIILAGLTGRTMAFAPAWLEDSAPANQLGNTVISGHNDSHFAIFEQVKLADQFSLEDRLGQITFYQVREIVIVDENDNWPYHYQNNTMLTLITCYPFTATTKTKKQRLIIQAHAI